MLVLARRRRAALRREVSDLDGFIRMAETLIGGARKTREIPAVDPFQARFNSGEVLPPVQELAHEWVPAEADGFLFREVPRRG